MCYVFISDLLFVVKKFVSVFLCSPLLFMKRLGAFLRLILIPLFWISANVNLSKAKPVVDLLPLCLKGLVKESKKNILG